MVNLFWTYEPFLFAFGLMVSSLCCGVHRSRSRSQRLVADQVVLIQLYLLQILWSQVLRTALKAARSPPPRRRRVPYDPFNPSEPPLTIYTEYRFTELPSLSNQPPTSPVSSQDNDVRYRSPIAPTPDFLRTHSLPPSRRRTRHHRSEQPKVVAPITFTPTVTLQEAAVHDDSSMSSQAVPTAATATSSTPVIIPEAIIPKVFRLHPKLLHPDLHQSPSRKHLRLPQSHLLLPRLPPPSLPSQMLFPSLRAQSTLMSRLPHQMTPHQLRKNLWKIHPKLLLHLPKNPFRI